MKIKEIILFIFLLIKSKKDMQKKNKEIKELTNRNKKKHFKLILLNKIKTDLFLNNKRLLFV